MANLDSGVGIYAPDAESYSTFADLFDPIICDYHTGFKPGDKHPPRDFGDVETLGNLDPEVSFNFTIPNFNFKYFIFYLGYEQNRVSSSSLPASVAVARWRDTHSTPA